MKFVLFFVVEAEQSRRQIGSGETFRGGTAADASEAEQSQQSEHNDGRRWRRGG